MACEKYGAELAYIESAEENDFIKNNILGGGDTPTTYIAGGEYAGWSEWDWLKGECVIMIQEGDYRGKWMKTDCTAGRGKPWGCCTADCICKKKRRCVAN